MHINKWYIKFFMVLLMLSVLLAIVMGLGGTSPLLAAPAPIRIAIVAASADVDMSWTQSMVESMAALKGQNPGVAVTIADGKVRDDVFPATIEQYAKAGYDIIYGQHAHSFADVLAYFATQYPKTTFVWGSRLGPIDTKGLPNFCAIWPHAEEAGYINGLMAALLTKTNTVGVMGAEEEGESEAYVKGFIAGAAATAPSVKVRTVYTGSSYDIFEAVNALDRLIAQGADVVSGIDPHVTVAIVPLREGKIRWLGVQATLAPEFGKAALASQTYNWAGVFGQIIADRAAGSLKPDYSISYAQGIQMVVNPDAALPDAVRSAAEGVIQNLAAGSFQTLTERKP